MDTKQRIARLIEEGFTVREIAGFLGLSTQAVYKHLKSLGVKPSVKVAS